MALDIQPLTRENFAPFGDVIETDGSAHFTINAGFAERFHDLAGVDVAAGGGRPLISIFRGQPRPAPLRLTLMERHPLGSQAFVPLQDSSWIVVVAAGADPCRLDALRAFRAGGRQGVNYARGTWHHPLIVLAPDHERMNSSPRLVGQGTFCDGRAFHAQHLGDVSDAARAVAQARRLRGGGIIAMAPSSAILSGGGS